MVQLDRRARAAAGARCSTCGASTSCAGSASTDDALALGALTTYTEIRRSAVCRDLLPALVEAAATIGAAQIQNRGTLGGNIANASPAGDTLPVLLATDADDRGRLGARRARRPRGRRSGPATARPRSQPDELIVRIRIPLVADRQVRFRKVGTRRAQAISKVVLALAGSRGCATCRGGRPARRSGSVADADPGDGDRGRPRGPPAHAGYGRYGIRQALAAEIEPIDDVRSTADYRRAVTARVAPSTAPRRRRLVVRDRVPERESAFDRAGTEPLRQVGDPPGQGRPRRRLAPGPGPDRRDRPRGRLRGGPHRPATTAASWPPTR